MARTKKQESTITRLTRWSVTLSLPKKGSKVPEKDGDTTIYGVDAEGNERVYAQIPSEKWEQWSKTDSMWKVAHSVMIQRLLSDPSTRDTVILTNIEGALKKGDEKMAFDLCNALSDKKKAEILAKPKA